MKFMLTWRLHTAQRQNALAAFSKMTADDEAADLGGIQLIGRWHNIAEGTGVAIYESDDPIAMANWALNWNPILDCVVAPVLDDAETRAVGKSRS
jgi:hypothetical protein